MGATAVAHLLVNCLRPFFDDALIHAGDYPRRFLFVHGDNSGDPCLHPQPPYANQQRHALADPNPHTHASGSPYAHPHPLRAAC